MIVPIAQSADGTLTDWLDTATSLRWTVTGGTPSSRAFNAQETAVATAAVTAGNATADTSAAITNLAVNKTVSTQKPSTTGYWLMRPGPSASTVPNGNLVGAVIEGRSGRADEEFPAEFLAFGDGDATTDNLSLQIWGPTKTSAASTARTSIQMFAKKTGVTNAVYIAGEFTALSSALGRLGTSATPMLTWDATSVTIKRPTWTGLSYGTGWSDKGSGFAAGAYTKDALGFVTVRGVVQNTGQAVTTIATLPTGYRPAATQIFLASCNAGTCRFHVNTDGTIVPQFYSSGSDSTFFSVECRFDPS